jgi:hypothetical protein
MGGAKVAMLARRAERLDALRSHLGERAYGFPAMSRISVHSTREWTRELMPSVD